MMREQNGLPIQASAGSDNVFRPGTWAFSSASISFQALMEILKAAREAANDMAEESVLTAKAQGNAVQAGAQATFSMYQDDATSTRLQANEQWVSMGSGVTNLAGTVGISLKFNPTAEQTKLNNLTKLETDTRSITGLGADAGNNERLINGQPDSEEDAGNNERLINGQPDSEEVAAFRRDIVRGNLHYDYTNEGVGQRVRGANGTPSARETDTVRAVLESESAATVQTFKENLARRIDTQVSAVQTASNQLQTWNQLLQMGCQAAGAGGSAHYKKGEADAMAEKAQDSASQAYAQAGQEFMRETGKSQQDQVDQFRQSMKESWRTLAEIIQVDARG